MPVIKINLGGTAVIKINLGGMAVICRFFKKLFIIEKLN